MKNKRAVKFSPGGAKGRPLNPQALSDVESLLGDRALRRDHLIEFLHLIQDEYGSLAKPHLVALAKVMR
ncbi:NADH-quinone oxidoreductase subunit F, partial [Gammaproteobacteria bacterium]|nr:NADH-quinone oxidoreductase subunit F [Gammaproteobacteria bacterium]